MIKKALFADELAAGMQRELRKIASGDSPDLVKAGECLHAALEIFEGAGLQKHANGVLSVLHKIAAGSKTKPVQKMPSLAELMKHGLTQKDIQQFGEGHHGAKGKMNRALRNMGLSEEEIVNFIGSHNVVPEEDLKRFETFTKWIDNPTTSDPGEIQPGQTVTIETVPDLESPAIEGAGPEDPTVLKELTFKSLANNPKKPGRPDKIHDIHVKGLTPEKEVKNIKHHGTPFNMPDLGWAEFEAAHPTDDMEDLNSIDDLLDADVFSTDELGDKELLQDFEEELASRRK